MKILLLSFAAVTCLATPVLAQPTPAQIQDRRQDQAQHAAKIENHHEDQARHAAKVENHHLDQARHAAKVEDHHLDQDRHAAKVEDHHLDQARHADYQQNRRDDRARHDFTQWKRNFTAPRRYHAPAYRRPAGWSAHRWTFGERLPTAYWGHDYWLTNYGSYGLQAPPSGATWVRVGDDALLIDQMSGEVIQVEYSVFE